MLIHALMSFRSFLYDTSVGDQHDINTDSIRTGLRLTPSDRLEINLTANYSTMDRAGPTYISIGPGGHTLQRKRLFGPQLRR